MLGGKLAYWGNLNFTLSWNASYSTDGSAKAICSAALNSYFATTYDLPEVPGIGMEVTMKSNGPGPPGPNPITSFAIELNNTSYGPYVLANSFITSGTVDVVITNYRAYFMAGGVIESFWDSALFTYNGSTILSLGADSSVSSFVAPCGVPLIGFPANLSCSSGSSEAPIIGVPPIYSVSSSTAVSCSCTANGGWRFTEHGSGTYVELPVTLDFVAPPTAPSICPDPGCPSPSATNTYNGAVSSVWSQTAVTVANYSTVLTSSGNSCSISLIPDLPKSVKRMNAHGSAVMVFRFSMPQSSIELDSTNVDYVGSSNASLSSVVNPNPTEVYDLAVVGNSTDPIEDAFSQHSYAVYSSQGVSFYGSHIGSAEQAQQLTRSSAFVGITDADWLANAGTPGVNQVLNYQPPPSLNTYGLIGKYINVWTSPHWSYMYWYENWTLDGASKDFSSYWGPIGTQWLSDPALPPLQDRQTRTDLCVAPFATSLMGLYSPSLPWGVSRFQAQNITPPFVFTFAAAQSSLFTFTNATAVYGANITVTPTTTSPSVSIALEGFSVEPYFLLALMERVAVNWAGANITAVSVSLVGQDGSVEVIGTAPGTLSWLTPPIPSKYLGSWGQDFSYGQTSDGGSDTLPAGESVAAMASPTQNAVSQILNGYTAASLQISFSLANLTPFTLDYPSFYTPIAAPTYLSETSMSGSYLYPKGPGVRVGQWNFTPTSAISATPGIYGLGSKQNVCDGLATKYALFKGIDPVTNTNTEIATLYDSTEGNTVADIIHGTASHWVTSNNVPTHIAINSLAELPPMATLPFLTHSPTTLQLTTTYAQEAWDYSCEPRYLIYPVSVTDLEDPSGSIWTAPSGIVVNGWNIRSHTHPVTNSEDATFKIVSNTVQYATVSPWHGYIWFGAASQLGGPKLECLKQGSLFVGYIQAKLLQTQLSTTSQPPWNFSGATGISVNSFNVTHAPDESIWLTVDTLDIHGNGVSGLYYSDDNGQTFGVHGSQVSSYQSDVRVNETGDLLWICYQPTSGTSGPGTFVGRYFGAGDLTVGSPFTLQGVSAPLNTDGSGFGFDDAKDQSRGWCLTFIVNGETSPSVWLSDDNGATWNRMTGT